MNKNYSKIDIYLIAIRPKTLFASVVPVLVGSAYAFIHNSFFPIYSFLALICSVMIQIGTNLTNDLYDYLKGADTSKRKGPIRVTSASLLTTKEIKIAITFCFILTFLLGLYLVYVTDWKILLIGILSILAGIAYTAGPFPLAYNGLGEVFTFLFFGIIGTMGTFYLHTMQITFIAFLISIPVGALITNILIVNNIRDIEDDRKVKKNTLTVLLGKKFSLYEYFFFVILSFTILIILFLQYKFSYFILLPFVSLPFTIKLIKLIFTSKDVELNKTLELTAKYSLLFGVLFSIGIISEKLI